MRKLVIVLALAISMMAVMTVPVGAAVLGEAHVGTECEFGFATLHFVNNQTGGETNPGTLTATFSGGTITTGPSLINKNTQHFTVPPPDISGSTLLSASTNLDGKLVLSDFTCNPAKKAPSKKAPTKKG